MSEKMPEWMKGLSEDDWRFVKRLILSSGSLKEVAADYGISYPTIRIRMNRLIEKVCVLDSTRPQSPFHRKIKLLVTDGKLDIAVARELIKEFEQTTKTEEKGDAL
ncbi:MAG: DUF2089 domain-containing protein [Anaerohalosphaeraceae bacterium]|nr:DUF2089 domain-containing protein [Anaerohalosphaeraceae bacterium]